MHRWNCSTLTYLDSATYGLPPAEARTELLRVVDAWSTGAYNPLTCDGVIDEARAVFARLHHVATADVAIGHQVAPLVGVVAASLPAGAKVLAAEGDFTSVLFPFLAAGCEVRTVPVDRIAEAIDAKIDMVAVSAVQSAGGEVADLAAIAAAARECGTATLIDSTQASGWLPFDASDFDAVVCGGYKWLCQPRGTAFMTISGRYRERVVPRDANWYAAADPWTAIYADSLQLADDARRFNVSPAWLNWHAALVSLQAIERRGIEAIHRHNVSLVNSLRGALGMELGNSAIVSLPLGERVAADLAAAGVKASSRAGRTRIACHLYNDADDIGRVLDVLEASGVPLAA